MYGDYEAQRHWMEITVHLPINEWFVFFSFDKQKAYVKVLKILTWYSELVSKFVKYL